jgi:hypothetical protein
MDFWRISLPSQKQQYKKAGASVYLNSAAQGDHQPLPPFSVQLSDYVVVLLLFKARAMLLVAPPTFFLHACAATLTPATSRCSRA